MILTELIKSQVTDCIVMLGAGILIMILYQLFCIICDWLEPAAVTAAILEIVFWAAAAVITVRFLYYCAYGRISFHAALSFAAGAILWKAVFYDIINKIYSRIYTKQGNRTENGEKETKQPIQREQSGN